MNLERSLEHAIGIFDVALSFSEDAAECASSLREFASYYSLSCYHYKHHLVRQSGLRLRDIMRHVYTSSPTIVILNSPLYRKTAATMYEAALIIENLNAATIIVVELGGLPLDPRIETAALYKEFSNETAVSIMRSLRSKMRN